jgi:hypothetical protein
MNVLIGTKGTELFEKANHFKLEASLRRRQDSWMIAIILAYYAFMKVHAFINQ